MIDRRLLLAGFAAAGLLCRHCRAWARRRPPRRGLRLGQPHAFSFDGLRRAGQKAGRPALSSRRAARARPIIQGIDFDKVQKIRFRPDDALWRGVAGADPIAFFHLNKYSADPVTIFALQNDAAGKQSRARFSTGRIISIMAPPGWIPSRWPSWASPASG